MGLAVAALFSAGLRVADLSNFAILFIYAFVGVGALVFSKKMWFSLRGREWRQMSKWMLAAGLSYGLSFTILLFVLSRTPFSVTVPIAYGLNLSLASLAGFWIFREPINRHVLIGNVFILVGSTALAVG